MKKILLLSIVCSVAIFSNAATHTVSNSPYDPAQFNNLQAAHDAAAAGDTLLVQYTGQSYGDLNVNKEVHIYGATSVLGQGRQVNVLLLYGTASSHSSFTSLHVTSLGTSVTGGEVIEYVEVRRCHIGNVGLGTTGTTVYQYWLFEGNVFFGNWPLLSFYINNNYDILEFSTFRYNVFNSIIVGVYNSLFDHNVFMSTTSTDASMSTVLNSTISNNIFYGVSTSGGIYNQGNNYVNNLSYGGSTTTFPIGISNNIGTGNIENSDPLFQNVPLNQPYDVSYDFNVMAGSLALGNASDEENIGARDNTDTFRKDAEPDIPVVRTVTIPGGNTVPAEGSFQITVHSVSHQ